MFCCVSSLALHLSRSSTCARRIQARVSCCVWRRAMSTGLLNRPVESVVKVDGPGSQFSVVSYNILSDNLREQHPDLYEECNEKFVTWEHRGPQLIREVVSYDADVICMQEVEKGHFDATLVPGFEQHGFKGFHVARNGDHPDGCATFYRTERFDLIKQQPVEYHRPGSNMLDRDNVALLLLLRSKESKQSAVDCSSPPDSTTGGEKRDSCAAGNVDTSPCSADGGDCGDTVLVANTHLLFNPRRGDVKLAQLMLLMAEAQRLSAITDEASSSAGSPVSHHPIILTGDFNLTPFSPIYWFLTTGGLYYEGADQFSLSGQERKNRSKPVRGATRNALLPEAIGVSNRCIYEDTSLGKRFNNVPAVTHPLGLASAYQHFFSRDELEFTTYHSRVCCTVDYIMFASDQFSARHDMDMLQYRRRLSLLGRRQLLRQAHLHPLGPLPNEQYASDHLAIQAFFQFAPAAGAPSHQSRMSTTPGASKRTRH
eukprot:scpid51370/ scgid13248/ Protein angel homolog 2